MQEMIRDLKSYGVGHGLMNIVCINMNINRILKVMKEIDANPPPELIAIIPDYHIYFDEHGKYLQPEIPNFIEYKYERMRIMATRAFKGNSDLENLLKIIDVYYKQHIEAIDTDIMDSIQSTEEKCAEITNICMRISEVIGGGNIDKSTANFRYKMISTLSVTNNMDSSTFHAIKQKIKPVEDIAIKKLCANCNAIANSQCKCGATYCSKDCRDIDWEKNGHKKRCSAVVRKATADRKNTAGNCAHCDIPASRKCICGLVYYCNTVCQKAHRNEHKSICKQRCCEIQSTKVI